MTGHQMYENIVVGVRDHESGLDGVALARQLAAADAAVTLLHVQVVAHKLSADAGRVRQLDEQRRALQQLADLRSSARIDAAVVSVAATSAAVGLHVFARHHDHDLIVVAASRAGDIDRLLLGDDTCDVLRDAPCAVAVAPLWYSGWAAPLRNIRSVDDLLVVEADEHRPVSRFLRISTLETLADRPVSPLLVVPAQSLEVRDDRSPASARA
jgi:nucleotide-binding universal stress UspA family protein